MELRSHAANRDRVLSSRELRDSRAELGWSQPVLAEILGTTAMQISRMERGSGQLTHLQSTLVAACVAAVRLQPALRESIPRVVESSGMVGALARVLPAAERAAAG